MSDWLRIQSLTVHGSSMVLVEIATEVERPDSIPQFSIKVCLKKWNSGYAEGESA